MDKETETETEMECPAHRYRAGGSRCLSILNSQLLPALFLLPSQPNLPGKGAGGRAQKGPPHPTEDLP